jgi:hypothetical protein
MRNRAAAPAFHIHDVTDEMIALAVIPHHGRGRPGHPLEHATLLPVPRAGLAEFDPFVAVLQVHHADADHVIRFRRAMLEIDLVREDEAVRRIELVFVVVREPVEFGAPRNRADRREGVRALRAERGDHRSGGDSTEE